MSFDIFTSVNVAMARKKIWIEPYSYQLREHIYESNRNINNEEELYEDIVGSSTKNKKRWNIKVREDEEREQINPKTHLIRGNAK